MCAPRGQGREQRQAGHEVVALEAAVGELASQGPLGSEESQPGLKLAAARGRGDVGIGQLLEAAQDQHVAIGQLEVVEALSHGLEQLEALHPAQAALVALRGQAREPVVIDDRPVVDAAVALDAVVVLDLAQGSAVQPGPE